MSDYIFVTEGLADQRGMKAARLEIWEHITFWDDVYYAILGMENELAS
jgi:hypothetical protein